MLETISDIVAYFLALEVSQLGYLSSQSWLEYLFHLFHALPHCSQINHSLGSGRFFCTQSMPPILCVVDGASSVSRVPERVWLRDFINSLCCCGMF